MIRFKKILIEGFGSCVLPTKFKFDREGLNIIIGDNGSGKSTVFNALYWVLYGKSLKGKSTIETWESLRTSEFKGTKVELKVEINGEKYLIIRCKEFKGKVEGSLGKNRLVILKNGQEITIRDKNDIQKKLEELINFSPDLFKNSILFGQRLKRIIQVSGPDKKKIFEEAFDAGFIQNAYDKAKKHLDTITPELNKYSILKGVSLAEYYAAKKHYLYVKDSKEKFITEKQEGMKRLFDLIEDSKAQMGKIKVINTQSLEDKRGELLIQLRQLQVPEKLDDLIFKQTNLVDKLEYELEVLETKRKGEKILSLKIQKTCPVCEQQLPANKIKEAHQHHLFNIAQYEDEIREKESVIKNEKYILEGYQSRISNNSTSSNELKIRIEKLEGKLAQAKTDANAFLSIKSKLEVYEQDYKQLSLKKFDGGSLRTIRAQYRISREKDKEITQNLKAITKEYDLYKWAMTGPLGNKGLRAYIFDTMIALLNERLKYYEQFIGYRIEFGVDLDSGNKDLYTVVYRGEDIINYEDLSGGQQQLVDICSAFGIYDVVSQGRDCNLLLFDEVFEGLDMTNVELVSELIRDKAHNKSLFLITHNTDLHNQSTKIIRMRLNNAGQTELKLL